MCYAIVTLLQTALPLLVLRWNSFWARGYVLLELVMPAQVQVVVMDIKECLELDIGSLNLNILLSHELACLMEGPSDFRLWSSTWNFASTLWNQVVHFLNPVPGFQKY